MNIRRKLLFSTLLLIPLTVLPKTTAVYHDAKELKHKINAVTVFSDQARIERMANVELSSGSHWVLVPRLPFNMIRESLNLKSQGGEIKQVLIEESFEYDFLPDE
ncbi:unnamed protein product, partial [marine sediment metagenome]